MLPRRREKLDKPADRTADKTADRASDKRARISLGSLLPAVIVRRRDRFTAVIRVRETGVGETEALAHIADSGRLKELVYPGNLGMVRKVPAPAGGSPAARVTSYDLVLACAGTDSEGKRSWVSIDTRYPNKVFGYALVNRVISEFAGYSEVHPEFSYVHEQDPGNRVPKSRLDFLLRGEGLPPALVEVKSVTLCVNGKGLFPDAPTVRGARHLRELMRAVKEGYRAYAVFIAQRSDIRTISPNRETDPGFADALKEAQRNGVRLLGFSCSVTPEEIVFDPSGLPVILS